MAISILENPAELFRFDVKEEDSKTNTGADSTGSRSSDPGTTDTEEGRERIAEHGTGAEDTSARDDTYNGPKEVEVANSYSWKPQSIEDKYAFVDELFESDIGSKSEDKGDYENTLLETPENSAQINHTDEDTKKKKGARTNVDLGHTVYHEHGHDFGMNKKGYTDVYDSNGNKMQTEFDNRVEDNNTENTDTSQIGTGAAIAQGLYKNPENSYSILNPIQLKRVLNDYYETTKNNGEEYDASKIVSPSGMNPVAYNVATAIDNKIKNDKLYKETSIPRTTKQWDSYIDENKSAIRDMVYEEPDTSKVLDTYNQTKESFENYLKEQSDAYNNWIDNLPKDSKGNPIITNLSDQKVQDYWTDRIEKINNTVANFNQVSDEINFRLAQEQNHNPSELQERTMDEVHDATDEKLDEPVNFQVGDNKSQDYWTNRVENNQTPPFLQERPIDETKEKLEKLLADGKSPAEMYAEMQKERLSAEPYSPENMVTVTINGNDYQLSKVTPDYQYIEASNKMNDYAQTLIDAGDYDNAITVIKGYAQFIDNIEALDRTRGLSDDIIDKVMTSEKTPAFFKNMMNPFVKGGTSLSVEYAKENNKVVDYIQSLAGKDLSEEQLKNLASICENISQNGEATKIKNSIENVFRAAGKDISQYIENPNASAEITKKQQTKAFIESAINYTMDTVVIATTAFSLGTSAIEKMAPAISSWVDRKGSQVAMELNKTTQELSKAQKTAKILPSFSSTTKEATKLEKKANKLVGKLDKLEKMENLANSITHNESLLSSAEAAIEATTGEEQAALMNIAKNLQTLGAISATGAAISSNGVPLKSLLVDTTVVPEITSTTKTLQEKQRLAKEVFTPEVNEAYETAIDKLSNADHEDYAEKVDPISIVNIVSNLPAVEEVSSEELARSLLDNNLVTGVDEIELVDIIDTLTSDSDEDVNETTSEDTQAKAESTDTESEISDEELARIFGVAYDESNRKKSDYNYGLQEENAYSDENIKSFITGLHKDPIFRAFVKSVRGK